jgi:hypothetical protein
MRLCAVALLAALACGLASSASAVNLPPIGLGGIHVIKISHQKNPKSCAAKSRSHKAVGKVARKLQPVACEQPPRAKLLDVGFAILFAP